MGSIESCVRRSNGCEAFRHYEKNGKNFVVYNRNHIERDIALGAWKIRWVVLSRYCVEFFVDTSFVDMPFVRCK